MTILFLLMISAAVGVFYLSLKHQGWLHTSLPKKFRIVAAVLAIAALACGLYSFSLGTTLFAIVAISILSMSLFPFVSLLKRSPLKKVENNGH